MRAETGISNDEIECGIRSAVTIWQRIKGLELLSPFVRSKDDCESCEQNA